MCFVELGPHLPWTFLSLALVMIFPLYGIWQDFTSVFRVFSCAFTNLSGVKLTVSLPVGLLAYSKRKFLSLMVSTYHILSIDPVNLSFPRIVIEGDLSWIDILNTLSFIVACCVHH